MDERFYPLYSCVAGGILGQFLFHAFPNSTGQTDSSVYSIFIFLGLYVMLFVHRCLRVSTGLVNYNGPNVFRGVELKHSVDHEDVTNAEYFSADLHNVQHFQAAQWGNTEEQHEKRRRRLLVLLYYFIALVMAIFEGLILVLNPVTALTIAMYWFNKLMHSCVIGIMFIYGAMHLRRLSYWLLATGWCVSIVVTTVPVLIDMAADDAILILEHGAAAVLYGTSAGVLFWLALNFLWLDSPQTTKKRTVAHMTLLALFAAGSYVTGFFT